MARKPKYDPVPLQNAIMDLYKEGHGYQKISKILKEEKGYQISHMTVKAYIQKYNAEANNELTEDQRLTNYVRRRIMDTGEQLRQVNTVLWDLIKDARTSKSFRLQTIKQIVDTIKLAEELMREFKGMKIEASGNSQVNIVQVVTDQLVELEKSGDIKIINPKLRARPVEARVLEENEDEEQDNSEVEGRDSNY